MMCFKPIPRHICRLGLTLLFLCAGLVTASQPQFVFAATSTPPECLTDQGQALVPENPAAWLLVLNFNHAPSPINTTGCYVYFIPKDFAPQYELIQCPLINNVNQAMVGDGAIKFDGSLWIECAPKATDPFLKNFYMEVTALFAQPGVYTLLHHPSVAMQASVDVDWHVTLTSMYGNMAPASNADPLTSANNNTLRLHSWMGQEANQQLGRHAINGTVLAPSFQAQPFPFDGKSVFRIGGQGEQWIATEVIIDPPRFCPINC